ncbi:50S ribosomal protein L10 [Firmicutes bacterium CAG:449]|nr:50S ribosomal protein L10 [Firmicutes bacterium CAG:449]
MNQNVLEAKKAKVAHINDVLSASKCFIVAEYRGLSVTEMSSLKRALAKSNAKCSVFKNSLVHRATENVEGFASVLEGPNAFIYAEDPIAGPKEAAKFAKTHPNFVIKGGIVEGKNVSAEEVKTLAKLPGREGLLSMLCSVLQAPVRNFACAVKAVAEKE